METPDFVGAYFDPKYDTERLTKQIGRIFDLMQDGTWRTLNEIAAATGDPQASISAQLRNLRKQRFGSYEVQVQSRGNRYDGLFEYKLIV